MPARFGNARVFVYCALLYSTNHTAALLEFLIASLKCRQFFVYHHNKAASYMAQFVAESRAIIFYEWYTPICFIL
jgi:hypothetical protein